VITQAKARLKATLVSYIATELAKLVTVTTPAGLTDFSATANGGTLVAPTADDIYTHRTDPANLWNAAASIEFADWSQDPIEGNRFGGQVIAPHDVRYTFVLRCYCTDTDFERAQVRAEYLAHAAAITLRRYGTATAPATADRGLLADVTTGRMAVTGAARDGASLAAVEFEVFAVERHNSTVTSYG
jgi:hypothetical protein